MSACVHTGDGSRGAAAVTRDVCPSCGSAELICDTRDMPYVYKGKHTIIPAVRGEFCPACGEVVLSREHGDRYSNLIGDFQRQVNAT
jgi:HTH-type transcriptional regulator / antitoxin MqsA